MAQNPNRDINESINEDKSNREVLVKADHVKVYFKGKDKKSGAVKAVDDVSLHHRRVRPLAWWGRAAAARVPWAGPLSAS